MNDKRADKDHFLIRAIETLKRQIIIISDNYTILASKIRPEKRIFLDENTKPEGKKCYAVFFNRTLPCLQCPVAEVKQTQRPSLNAGHFDDNHIEPSCLYAYPMDGGDGNKNAIVVLDFHLPVLDQFDEKRFTSNAFLRNLIHSAVDGVIAADMTGRIIIFNKAASEIAGYTRDEAMETVNIRDIYPGDDARVIMEKMRSSEHGKEGIIRSYKQLAVRKDGSTIPILLNASIVYEEDREIATIGFFHDLTETIRMESELEKAQTQLLQSEKMSSLGKLAAGVAHQLNNPLGGITLFSQLMLEEHEFSDKAREDLLRIKNDAERCSSIVKELLEFARQTRREVKLHNINEIIARTLFLLCNQALFQNIVIVENYDETIPEIPADVQQLNHVFMNIILNAADAMEGQGRIEISSVLNRANNTATIQICDTGPGIDEEALPSIFEPFFTTKEQGKGTGLGLSMVYGIVESHGGSIKAANKKDGGAVFSIDLPLEQKK